jgi:peptide deformylase
MVREILIWPDPELLKVSKPVEHIDDDIKVLVKDMLATMYDAEGVGLAAPQVGVHKRVVVIDIHSADAERPSGEEPLVLINPEFVHKEGSLAWEEGCLSVPGETGTVTRSAKVKVKYLDLEGKTVELEAEGLKAVALQHECDHLDGKLFVDYLSRLKRNVIKRKMQKLREDREAGILDDEEEAA